MTALLDVNVVIALLDGEHQHHAAAHVWFASCGAWATCPIVENGVLRILTTANYAGGAARPEDVLAGLSDLRRAANHVFWMDSISILEKRRFAQITRLKARSVTDLYLLALAIEHGGRFVTFDRSVPISAVAGAEDRHIEILST